MLFHVACYVLLKTVSRVLTLKLKGTIKACTNFNSRFPTPLFENCRGSLWAPGSLESPPKSESENRSSRSSPAPGWLWDLGQISHLICLGLSFLKCQLFHFEDTSIRRAVYLQLFFFFNNRCMLSLNKTHVETDCESQRSRVPPVDAGPALDLLSVSP